MFWCMFAFDVIAIYCDILQNRDAMQAFYSVHPMPSHALACGFLQHSEIWTQNPVRIACFAFDGRADERNARPLGVF
jgi:hypothetical protein